LAQEVGEAKEALGSEQGKVFRLEVQLAEAVQKLQQVTDLEKELSQYRQASPLLKPCKQSPPPSPGKNPAFASST